MKKIYLFIVLILITDFLHAAEKHVPGQFTSIQSALNACTAGDIVIVEPGIYSEYLSWPHVQNISLKGRRINSDSVVIDGNRDFTKQLLVIAGTSINDLNASITGITFRNAGRGVNISNAAAGFDDCNFRNNLMGDPYLGPQRGAGMLCTNSTVKISGSSFYNNSRGDCSACSSYLSFEGYALFVKNSNVKVVHSNIHDNGSSAFQNGAVISADSSAISFDAVKIQNNISSSSALLEPPSAFNLPGGVALDMDASNIKISNSLFANNSIYATLKIGKTDTLNGGAIVVGSSGNLLRIENCTITGTSSKSSGLNNDSFFIKGKSVFISEATGNKANKIDIINSVLWNDGQQGNELFAGYGNNAFVVQALFSDIKDGYAGKGNLSSNPVFVSESDFHLKRKSPCINAGKAIKQTAQKDLDGNPRIWPDSGKIDMGCYELQYGSTLLAAADEAIQHDVQSWFFPNPATGIVRINITGERSEAGLFLYNPDGKLLLHRKNLDDENYIDVSSFSNGLYILKITREGKPSFTGKLIVQHQR
ncbi:MAG TPA: T9SS type A sorting domain-containing protein [Panacibacter sp.]|nr:T9SS type A sorting domain-containing protein [Panacibacter sp.]HNP44522.1 T9SS type A sorting domain-containing protein [Panacibacter sp.]